MKIVLFGAPGCGKGTQAAKINQKYNIPHISTGDLFRENIAKNTKLGLIAKEYINQGQLVPDGFVCELIKDRISKEDCKNGFILDGFPRTLNQAKELEKITKIDAVIFIDVSMSEIEIRAVNRRLCPACGKIFSMLDGYREQCDVCGVNLIQREDDKISVIRKRIQTYLSQSEPLIKFYQKKKILNTILSEKSADETFVFVDEILSKLKRKKA